MNQPLYAIWLGDVMFCFSGETSEPRVDAWSSVVRRLKLSNGIQPFRQAALRLAELRVPNAGRAEQSGVGKRRAMLGRTLEGLALEPADALELLLRLSEQDCAAAGIQAGEELPYWRTAARFALELIHRGEVVPSIQQVQSGGARRRGVQESAMGVWQPRLESEEDIGRFRELAAAMPAIGLSAPTLLANHDPSSREEAAAIVLHSFMSAIIQQEMRKATAERERELSRQRPDYRRGTSPLADLWWNSLLTGTRPITIQGTPAEMEELHAQVASLNGAGIPQSGKEAREPEEGSLRLCLRLEPPLEEGATSWQVTFWAESVLEPSLRLSAADIWTYDKPDLERGHIIYRSLRLQLLMSMGRAAEVSREVRGAMQNPYPEAFTLSPEQFYPFLLESVPRLQKIGAAVQMPSKWSKEGRKRAGLRLRMRENTEGAAFGTVASEVSPLGMHQIVAFDAEAVLGGNVLSLAELEAIAATNLPYVHLRGEWVEIDPKELRQVLRYIKKQEEGEMTLAEWMHLSAEQDPEEGSVWKGISIYGTESFGLLGSLLEGGVLRSIAPRRVPAQLHGQLRPYQERGFQWLSAMRDLGFGVCLADDMGLGKTIQVITCLLDYSPSNSSRGPALIICPTSLLGNWQRELQRFAPDLSLYIHHGGQRLHGEDFVNQVMDHEIVLTTYHLAGRDGGDLSAVSWSSIVLDEAQYIKNSRTKQSQSVMKLSAPHRIAMTGTPVENRLSELWSIFHFLNPGYLGSAASFRHRYTGAAEDRQEMLRELHKLVSPFMLRRLKSDPDIRKDLPEKLELKSYCVLTPEQAGMYRGVVDQLMGTLDGQSGIARKGLVLSSLTKLKQICNHPALLGSKRGDNAKSEASGKMERLLELIEAIRANGEAALIFTQYVAMGELLVSRLARMYDERPSFLHGGLSKQQRDELVQRFQQGEGPDIFILSLRAGGVGLNLTRASHVIHYDRWWNPAVENQATDRVFRIGQNRNVQVHKLICQGTLEERIDELIESKKMLSEQVVGSGENWLTEMSDEELRGLVALQNDIWLQGE